MSLTDRTPGRTREKVPVEVARTIAPDGEPAVLLQLPQGWVVMRPGDAQEVAQMLIQAAEECEPK